MALNENNAADIFTQLSGEWEYKKWAVLKDVFHGKSDSPHPNCSLLVGEGETGRYNYFIDHQNFNMHPYDFLHSCTPVINYILERVNDGEDCFMKVLPMFSYNADSLILAGTAGNTSAVIKMNASLEFKCLESVTADNLAQDIKTGELKLSVENKHNQIFQNVDINLSNLSATSWSFGLNFNVLGIDYKIACKPVLLGGIVNVFTASGTAKKAVSMEIGGHEFELDISFGYEAVIEQHKSFDQSEPIFKIPGIATELNHSFVKVRPVEVNMGMPQAVMNVPALKSNAESIARPKFINSSKTDPVLTFSWYDNLKMQASAMCVVACAYLISQHPNGVKSVKFSDGLTPPSATTTVISAGFTAVITGVGVALARIGLLTLL